MSLQESRAAIAAAAATAGITAHPYYVQSTTPGVAYVRLERIQHPNRFGGVVTWNVVVILPQDSATAEQYLEDNVPAIRDAVAAEMVVTEVTPTRLEIDGVGTILTCFITGHREEVE